jgi:predicted DCC family thiol-disulfide oxidoreductase YuxK
MMPLEQYPRPTENPFDRQRTVVFDGVCPMCRREMAHHQYLDSANRMRP